MTNRLPKGQESNGEIQLPLDFELAIHALPRNYLDPIKKAIDAGKDTDEVKRIAAENRTKFLNQSETN